MNFLDTWQELDEIYSADYTKTGNKEVKAQKHGLSTGLLYHFFSDLSDLLNSMENGIIYSTKNDKDENKAQYDYSSGVEDGMAYVCMTHTLDGKEAAIKSLGRPFGFSFNAKELAARGNIKASVGRPAKNTSKSGYSIKSFDAWGAKGNYYTSPRKNPHLLAQTAEHGNNPFTIQAVGELPSITVNGEPRRRFFVSGGQNSSSQWSAKIFYQHELYEKLRDWFKNSYESGQAYQQRMFYHFRDGKVGGPKQDNPNAVYNGKLIDVEDNLNKNYKPFAFTPKGAEAGTVSYTSSIAFDFAGEYRNDFVEVIGYGPFQIKEDGKLLLGLAPVKANASGGYKGPYVFGKDIDTKTFYSDKTQIRYGQGRDNEMADGGSAYSIQQHLMADAELFSELSAIYDEHEYRIYLQNSRDFRFAASEIQTLVLPEVFRIAKTDETVDLVRLIKGIEEGTVVSNDLDSLKKEGIVVTSTKKAPITPYLKDLLTALIELLQTSYNNVGVEFIPNTNDGNAVSGKADIGSYQRTGEVDVGIPLNTKGNIPQKDHARKVTTTWPDLDTVELVPGQHGDETTTAQVHLPGGLGPATARIGSEVILIAEDEQHNKYVLFVYKSKSPMFMELPGGGFNSLPSSTTDFKQLLMDKLKFKCNLTSSNITTPEDTGKALLLHEVGVAQDAAVTWPWSYYRLYSAKLKDTLSGDCLADLGYSFNNKELADQVKQQTGIDIHSYRAHMRWVPVKHITLNRAITDRYSNIIPLIQSIAGL